MTKTQPQPSVRIDPQQYERLKELRANSAWTVHELANAAVLMLLQQLTPDEINAAVIQYREQRRRSSSDHENL